MIIVTAIKNLLLVGYSSLARAYNLAKLTNRYPNCKFYAGANIGNCTFGGYNVVFDNVAIDGCTIDAHTYIQKYSAIFNADIGKYCSIATNVSIGPGMHKTDGATTHPAFFLLNTPLVKTYTDKDITTASKKITIGHDVWIGEKAILLDGINIGTGAIIAAGAVVTKDIAPYTIVGGIPAKEIRKRFTADIVEKLLASEWWNKSEQWISDNYKLFGNVDLVLNAIDNK